MNLPDEAAEHPVIEELNTLAVDMIVLDNVSRGKFCHFLRLIGRPLAVGYLFIQRGAGPR